MSDVGQIQDDVLALNFGGKCWIAYFFINLSLERRIQKAKFSIWKQVWYISITARTEI